MHAHNRVDQVIKMSDDACSLYLLRKWHVVMLYKNLLVLDIRRGGSPVRNPEVYDAYMEVISGGL